MSVEQTDYTTTFGALPHRAISDTRLSALELRTLAAIAFHDRFSIERDGSGCYATHETLAERLGCHYTRVSTSVKRLVELGYVHAKKNPNRRRHRIYYVLY